MKWGYAYNPLNNFPKALLYDIKDFPMALITGSSGSGKTYCLLYLLGSLLQSNPNIEIWFVDFKNRDYAFLNTYSHYFSGDICYQGIMEYYNVFTKCRLDNTVSERYLMICDEYPSLINYLQTKDKLNKTKYANDILSAISEILMMGRGLSCGVWISTQRADSSIFNGVNGVGGARDNFMITILLGRASREQKTMLFSGEDIPERVYKKGEGIILVDGQPLQEVRIPYIQNIVDWKRHIIKILCKEFNS